MATAEELVGRVVGDRYRIEAVLAAHESGAVYRAQHLRLLTSMALKVLRPGAAAADVARLRREAVAGARVRHPNVVAVTDSGDLADGSLYVALEHVEGATLREVSAGRPMEASRVVRIGRQLLAGLSAIHEQGIVHRDIEPQNVILSGPDRDQARIIDFGRAKLDSAQPSSAAFGSLPPDDLTRKPALTSFGVVVGSIAYLPPEAALGSRDLDARADLYSLGVVLFELLAGKRPFDAEDSARLFIEQRDRTVPRIAERAPGVSVPEGLEKVLQRLLARDRDARYPSAEAALAALEAAVEETTAAPAMSPRTAALADLLDRGQIVAREGRSLVWGGLRRARAALARTGIPGWAVAASAGPLVLLVAVVWWLASGTASAPAETSTPTSAQRLGEQQSGPVPDVAPVAALSTTGDVDARAPRAEGDVDGIDAAGWRKELQLAVTAQNWSRASKAIEALAALDPVALDESGVTAGVVSTAVAVESVGGEGADALYELLSARLGHRGLELLFEIMQRRGGTKGSKRAADALKTPAAQALATPALRVAFELQQARCEDKPALFARAAEEGDRRVLTSLRVLREAKCPRRKKGPCCFEHHPELARAIKRLRERLGVPTPPPSD